MRRILGQLAGSSLNEQLSGKVATPVAFLYLLQTWASPVKKRKGIVSQIRDN